MPHFPTNTEASYRPCFDKTSVANTAVDERFAMFYSAVISGIRTRSGQDGGYVLGQRSAMVTERELIVRICSPNVVNFF